MMTPGQIKAIKTSHPFIHASLCLLSLVHMTTLPNDPHRAYPRHKVVPCRMVHYWRPHGAHYASIISIVPSIQHKRYSRVIQLPGFSPTTSRSNSRMACIAVFDRRTCNMHLRLFCQNLLHFFKALASLYKYRRLWHTYIFSCR